MAERRNTDITEGLIREYLSTKGLTRTLETFNQENPKTDSSISKRGTLRKALGLEQLAKKTQAHNSSSSDSGPRSVLDMWVDHKLNKSARQAPQKSSKSKSGERAEGRAAAGSAAAEPSGRDSWTIEALHHSIDQKNGVDTASHRAHEDRNKASMSSSVDRPCFLSSSDDLLHSRYHINASCKMPSARSVQYCSGRSEMRDEHGRRDREASHDHSCSGPYPLGEHMTCHEQKGQSDSFSSGQQIKAHTMLGHHESTLARNSYGHRRMESPVSRNDHDYSRFASDEQSLSSVPSRLLAGMSSQAARHGKAERISAPESWADKPSQHKFSNSNPSTACATDSCGLGSGKHGTSAGRLAAAVGWCQPALDVLKMGETSRDRKLGGQPSAIHASKHFDRLRLDDPPATWTSASALGPHSRRTERNSSNVWKHIETAMAHVSWFAPASVVHLHRSPCIHNRNSCSGG
eukprot:evm.model.scf_636EXC.9 EVM.evm.TU.scf_636EXC.9   scf_636EXC:55888-58477(+)